MKKRLLISAVLLALAGGASAYFVSLDAPQDFPVNI
jgi:hypothetical protein